MAALYAGQPAELIDVIVQFAREAALPEDGAWVTVKTKREGEGEQIAIPFTRIREGAAGVSPNVLYVSGDPRVSLSGDTTFTLAHPDGKAQS